MENQNQVNMKNLWIFIIRSSVKFVGRTESRKLFTKLLNALPVEEKQPLQEAFIEIFSLNRQ